MIAGFIYKPRKCFNHAFDYRHLHSLWKCIIIGLITEFVNYTVNTNQPKWNS